MASQTCPWSADDVVTLVASDDCRVTVHLFGATIISWIDRGEEIIFVSAKSAFDNKKAIRGGIPIVFPNFGPWTDGRPQHGFARISRWEIESEKSAYKGLDAGAVKQRWKKKRKNDSENNDDYFENENEEEEETLKLFLSNNQSIDDMWPHKFRLVYTVSLSAKRHCLRTELIIENNNTNQEPFDCTFLLHSYFRVDDVRQTTITGFENIQYIDKLIQDDQHNPTTILETRNEINIDQNIDRIYKSTADDGHKINKKSAATTTTSTEKQEKPTYILLRKHNLPDTVVWNPWSLKAKQMADFDDNEYLKMLCVEAGYVHKPLRIQAGCKYTATLR